MTSTEEHISIFQDGLRHTLEDFLNHELILDNPYALSDDELWAGIEGRSNKRATHRCELINRMNGYCTLVKVVGHRSIPTNYKTVDCGVLQYVFNKDSEIELLYSSFKYPHSFHDEGMVSSSFSGNSTSVRITIDMISDGKRETGVTIQPSSLFENQNNIGTDIFLEYTIQGVNQYNSIKSLPSLVNIEGKEPYFLNEVRNSLLKTKYFLLSLVSKYPRHFMHMMPSKFMNSAEFISSFDKYYREEMKTVIEKLRDETAMEIANHDILAALPL